VGRVLTERAQELIPVRSLGYLARHVCSTGYAKPSGCSCPAVTWSGIPLPEQHPCYCSHMQSGAPTSKTQIAGAGVQSASLSAHRIAYGIGGNQTRLINYERVAEKPNESESYHREADGTPTLNTGNLSGSLVFGPKCVFVSASCREEKE